ncbi:helix-turn-helix domain-containing protein [Photorhabdus tasmaniensis]|uniref:helix-turn-helix domain-containing protein n=1 Tax=Photorhabdus tasmaniensis TaxID=1004159 RepID=UPI0040420FA3
MKTGVIRDTCFKPAQIWTPPTPEEIRFMIESVLNISQESLAKRVGITGRTIRRWVAGDAPIAYSVWCILCVDAGLPPIWK